MPSISIFYGLIVYMHFMDNKQHKLPHIHVKYQDDEVVCLFLMAMYSKVAFPIQK